MLLEEKGLKEKYKTVEEAESFLLPITEPTVDWKPYPKAESWREMSNRVFGFLDHITSKTDEDTVLIISHGNALVPVVHWWLGLSVEHWSRISYDFDCASITKLTVNEWGERVISKLNDTSHLVGI